MTERQTEEIVADLLAGEPWERDPVAVEAAARLTLLESTNEQLCLDLAASRRRLAEALARP